MSYITKAEALRKCENKIPELEGGVLSANPFSQKKSSPKRPLNSKNRW